MMRITFYILKQRDASHLHYSQRKELWHVQGHACKITIANYYYYKNKYYILLQKY